MTYEQRHAKRYALSLDALRPHLRPGMIVLECGPRSTFAATLEREFGVKTRDTRTDDLRHLEPWTGELGSQIVDAVLCMEVLEHIHDQEPEDRVPTEWAGTGVAQMLSSLYSALKPGGLLFLTTPNACSLNALHKALLLEPPMVYRPHVREYGPHEVAALAKRAGFQRIKVTSHDVWDNDCMAPAQAQRLRECIQRLGYRTDCRGEDLFLTAHKPIAQEREK